MVRHIFPRFKNRADSRQFCTKARSLYFASHCHSFCALFWGVLKAHRLTQRGYNHFCLAGERRKWNIWFHPSLDVALAPICGLPGSPIQRAYSSVTRSVRKCSVKWERERNREKETERRKWKRREKERELQVCGPNNWEKCRPNILNLCGFDSSFFCQ